MAEIEVIKIRNLTGSGSVKAFISIRAGGITINKAKIVKQGDQRAWLAMPDEAYTAADGKTRYSPFVEITESLRKRMTEIAVAEWERLNGD